MKLTFVSTLFFVLFSAVILILTVRGISGNPTSQTINQDIWKDEGPLELSPERGRFALLMSLIEDNSFYFSLPIARFATPDLGFANGKYVSLFAPGVSFIAIPGYLLGKMFGISQVGAFAVISLFALINALLVRSIAQKLGASAIPATIGSFVFLFASPAFAYATSLYQHHISTFLILASLFVLLRVKNKYLSLTIVWFMCAFSIPVDYPNVVLMAPIGLLALSKIFWVEESDERYIFKFKPFLLTTFIAMVLPLIFFMWFNYHSYNNPLQFSGTISSVRAIDAEGRPTKPGETGTEDTQVFTDPSKQKKSAIAFFQTRQMLNGFFIHFISPDRGIVRYAPVVLLGVLGMFLLYRKNATMLSVLLGVVSLNLLLYSMWGDPWGGWAFGSRYMIPSFAILAICSAVALHEWRRRIIFVVLFLALLWYSIAISTLGALTTNRIPPKVEVLSLEAISGMQQRFSFGRNYEMLLANRSKSYIYQTYFSDQLTAFTYYQIITGALLIFSGYLMAYLYFHGRAKS